jgi:hypothetical protein
MTLAFEHSMPLADEAPYDGRVSEQTSSFARLGERLATSASLSETVQAILSEARSSELFEVDSALFRTLKISAAKQLNLALSGRATDELSDVHRALFLLQTVHFAGPHENVAQHQFNPALVNLRETLEDGWINGQLLIADIPIRTDSVREDIVTMCKAHPAASHRVFDFMASEASLEHFRVFFESDAHLNLRFFDLLALCLVGTAGTAKTELASNLWDEAGRGNGAAGHVTLFANALAVVGGRAPHGSDLHDQTWQALAGHNLFVALCASRKNQFKAVGLMAATELLDPSQYAKLVAGCERVGFPVPTYYSEHVEIDIVHGDGWLDNVVTPIASANPAAAKEILEGVALRLNSCLHYYDCLLARLDAMVPNKQAGAPEQ